MTIITNITTTSFLEYMILINTCKHWPFNYYSSGWPSRRVKSEWKFGFEFSSLKEISWPTTWTNIYNLGLLCLMIVGCCLYLLILLFFVCRHLCFLSFFCPFLFLHILINRPSIPNTDSGTSSTPSIINNTSSMVLLVLVLSAIVLKRVDQIRRLFWKY